MLFTTHLDMGQNLTTKLVVPYFKWIVGRFNLRTDPFAEHQSMFKSTVYGRLQHRCPKDN